MEAETSLQTSPSITGPLIFSCGKCHTIIGDSSSLVGTHSQLKTITLSAASKVTRTDNLVTSQSSIDKGSTFIALICYNCSRALGRYYITTPRSLDELREKFTFFVDEISSYELGKAEYGESESTSTGFQSNSSGAATTNEEIEEGILKIQHVILGLEERIRRIEEFIRIPPPILTIDCTVSSPSQLNDGHQTRRSISNSAQPPNTQSLKPSIPSSESSYGQSADYWTDERNEATPARKKARK